MEDCLFCVFVANDEKCNKHCDCIDHELKICYIPEAYDSGYRKAIDDVIQKVKSMGLSGISSSEGNLIYVLESMKGEQDDNQ